MKGIGTIIESALWRVILNVESRLMPDPIIDSVKVYSSTKANRERFAEEMTELLNVEVRPVANPEELSEDLTS